MAQIWGDYRTAASGFEVRVCERLSEQTPSSWIVISGSQHSYKESLQRDFDVLLFSPKHCFVIEVKGGNIQAISDEKWIIAYDGNPPQSLHLFRDLNTLTKMLKGKLIERNRSLRNLWVEPIICCDDRELQKHDLSYLDDGNRRMIVPLSELVERIVYKEKHPRFKYSPRQPSKVAQSIFSRVQPRLPRLMYEDLRVFQDYDDCRRKGPEALRDYTERVYSTVEQYFRYVGDKIAETTERKLENCQEKHMFLPHICDRSKLYNRPYLFVAMVRYPETDYVDFAQLAFNFGYYSENWLDLFNLWDAIKEPGYVIATKAAVFKSNRPDRDVAAQNLRANGSYFLRKLKELGSNYFFLYYGEEDPETHEIITAAQIEELGDGSFFESWIGPYSKAISFEGFFELTKDLVEKPKKFVEFVSGEFVKLYPIYKYLYQTFPMNCEKLEIK